jgi:hypothetical protein
MDNLVESMNMYMIYSIKTNKKTDVHINYKIIIL